MSRIRVGLTNSATMSHVPLAALGYALRRAGILKALDEVEYGIKASRHTAQEKLMEGLVLVLAGDCQLPWFAPVDQDCSAKMPCSAWYWKPRLISRHVPPFPSQALVQSRPNSCKDASVLRP